MVEEIEDERHPTIVVAIGVDVKRARSFLNACSRENFLDDKFVSSLLLCARKFRKDICPYVVFSKNVFHFHDSELGNFFFY